MVVLLVDPEVEQVMVVPEVLETLVDILQVKEIVEEIILVIQHTLVLEEGEPQHKVVIAHLIVRMDRLEEMDRHHQLQELQ